MSRSDCLQPCTMICQCKALSVSVAMSYRCQDQTLPVAMSYRCQGQTLHVLWYVKVKLCLWLCPIDVKGRLFLCMCLCAKRYQGQTLQVFGYFLWYMSRSNYARPVVVSYRCQGQDSCGLWSWSYVKGRLCLWLMWLYSRREVMCSARNAH